MAFTEGPTVLHIKLTDKGRQLLSTGQLTFKKYAIGDSEIDYEFNDRINFSTFKQKLLRPKDNNPNIVDFIEQTVGGDTMIDLPTTVSNTSVITNTAKEKGFFATGSTNYQLQTDADYVKNSGGKIYISGVTGGLVVDVKQSSIYSSSSNEPIVGDYLMVKWANPYLISGTTSTSVDEAVPYVWYKISGVTGTLADDDLVLEVDTPLPNFNGNGGDIASLAYIYPNSNNRLVSGDSIQTYYGSAFTTDFLNDAVFSFIENWDCISQDDTCDGENDDVPVWNMGIVFTEEIEGVKETDYNYSQYYTREIGGFVRYIQQVSPWIKKLGVIHYTNKYPYNVYGEGLVGATPILELPTLMWHKETGDEIGVTLSAGITEYELSGLSTNYRDLEDQYGNIVGKVFNDLQVFVIEDQELLFAMSYKGNRSWTLPEFTAALNVSLCPESDVEIEILDIPTTTTTTTIAPTTTTTTIAPTTTTTTTAAVNNYTVRLTNKQVLTPFPDGETWIYQLETTPSLVSGDEIQVTFGYTGETNGNDVSFGLEVHNVAEKGISGAPDGVAGEVDEFDWSVNPTVGVNPKTVNTSTMDMVGGSGDFYEIRLVTQALGTTGSTYSSNMNFNIIQAIGVAGSVGTVTIDNSETSTLNISGTI